MERLRRGWIRTLYWVAREDCVRACRGLIVSLDGDVKSQDYAEAEAEAEAEAASNGGAKVDTQ